MQPVQPVGLEAAAAASVLLLVAQERLVREMLEVLVAVMAMLEVAAALAALVQMAALV